MLDLRSIEYLVISVLGPHAGESEAEILKRKIQDINNAGITFWLMKSRQAKPNMVQELYLKAKSENKFSYCVFVKASSKRAAIPTKTAIAASSYSKDKINWEDLPHGLSPITGKLDSNAYALTFDSMQIADDVIDLWQYANFFDIKKPVRIIQGASTICAVRKDMRYREDMIKSRYRGVVAFAQLCKPGCVYLR
jgi:hypothetical protein